MKRVLLSLFTLLLCASLFSGCESELAEEYEIGSFDGESRIDVSTEVIPGEQSVAIGHVSFLARDKKYVFKENNFVILDVTNESDSDCGVTVSMTYKDSSGAVLGTEEKTFGCFSAGYQNKFCFNPGYAFESYSYSLTVDEYTGNHYEDHVAVKGLPLSESMQDIDSGISYVEYDGATSAFDDFEKHPAITFSYTYANTADTVIYVPTTFVLFNQKDEVIAILDHIATIEPGWEFCDDYNTMVLYVTDKEKLIWPEKYQGDIRIVTCYRDVTTVEP